MTDLLYNDDILRGLSLEEAFGKMPKKPLHLTIEVQSINFCFLNEKAELRELVARIDINDKTVYFPFISVTAER